ncbi:MAG: hypothetical protein ACAH95_02290 [Fimbriimonas sp.]
MSTEAPKKERPTVPDESSPVLSKRSVWLTVGGVILFAFLANLALIPIMAKCTPNSGYKIVHKKWQLLSETPDVDIVIVGDSSGDQGVDPDVLKQELGLSALNLCTVGDMMVLNDAAMVEEYLRTHTAPKMVIDLHVYDVWERDVAGSALAQIPFSVGQLKQVTPWIKHDFDWTADIVTSRYLPLYSESKSFKQLVFNTLTRKKARTDEADKIGPNGFLRQENSDPDLVNSDLAKHTETLQNLKATISDTNKQALQRLIQLSNEKGFSFYLVSAPIYQGLADLATFQKHQKELSAKLEEILKPLKNGGYLFPEPRSFPMEVMQNVDHLTVTGAEDFTKQLVEEIRKHESGI